MASFQQAIQVFYKDQLQARPHKRKALDTSITVSYTVDQEAIIEASQSSQAAPSQQRRSRANPRRDPNQQK